MNRPRLLHVLLLIYKDGGAPLPIREKGEEQDILKSNGQLGAK
ncbi:MAG: hypothetical protein NT178_09215 [Proteobacteria bacterium]|nr:hypothetical protein [Pseudomonadota bacterium]